MSSCSDKDCVSCRMKAIADELVKEEVPVDLAVTLLFAALGEAYKIDFGMVEVREQLETLH